MTSAIIGAAASAAPNLRVEKLTKSFGAATVLQDVSFELGYGEIHGLLGHNGSGKSTLIKILTGVYEPDAGRVWIGGRELPLPLPSGEFNRYGIAVVHQALGLVPSLSVTENVLVRRLVRDANPMIDWSSARREVRALLDEYGLAIQPDMPVADLPPVERALLAIVRALNEIRETVPREGGLLILDEPTPFLSRPDVERLFDLVRGLAKRGTSVVFVSHDVDEVMELTDRATVLRNGAVTASLITRNASKTDFIAAIVGRHIHTGRSVRPALDLNAAVEIRGLTGPGVRRLDLSARHGEVVGLTGLIGSGYDRVPYFLYGAETAAGGTLALSGPVADLSGITPSAAMRMGIVLVPGDRQGAAIVDGLTVAENLALPAFGVSLPRWWVTGRQILNRGAELVQRFDVRPPDPNMPMKGLSGGNQQKVVLAKWLQSNPSLILLDEPTQGVDVGARQQVYEFIQRAADRGATVICASSDHEQLESICDRVLIFSQGRVVASLVGDEITKHAITERCLNSIDGSFEHTKETAP
ncbi:sugar ABC transporter ATP-binding protein [Microvirga sp. G4-2]|uniref:sugar ABC transporter ATP-binding protein n=1 Tax=Microvirga sp. G4-2 TaxID=3434467 RepID=UPI0040448AA6